MKTCLFAILAGSMLITTPAFAKGRQSGDDGFVPLWCLEREASLDRGPGGTSSYDTAWAQWLEYVAAGGTLDYRKWSAAYWHGPCPREDK
jgi:hypothetical protein